MKLSNSEVESSNGSANGPASAAPSTRRFGVFELDLRAGELRRNGVRIKLQEQPFQILAQLLENPGEVVTREDLRNRLWPADTFVDFDHSLNAAIKRLRNALSDSAENPTFVETVARRGYRFLAPVTANGHGAATGHAEGIHPIAPAPVIPGHARRGLHPYGWWILTAGAAVLLLIGLKLGLSLGQRHAVAQPQAQLRVSRLTANPAEDHVRAASISRDGKYLAFSDQTGFYLRQIDTGETHPITLPAGMTVTFVSWFPDSVHLIVSLTGAASTSGIWEISSLGGNPRKLSDDGRSPVVSPDGKTIAFICGSSMRNMRSQISLMAADGTQPRKLLGDEGDFFDAIAWSPDGARIAYNRGRFGYAYYLSAVIEIVDVRSRRVSRPFSLPRVTEGWYSSIEGPLAWASDGRLIYTLGETPPRQLDSNLWSIALDPAGNPTGTPLRLTNDAGEVASISTSTDGKRIAYLKGVPQPDVYVAKLEGQSEDEKISEPQRLTLDDRQDMPFDWTPDSKSVIFISDRTGLFSIYRQRIDQTVPELLAGGESPLLGPRLTPDGSQILYLVYPNWNAKTVSSISMMRMPVAGGAPQKVLEGDWISNLQCARSPATVCLYSTEKDGALTLFRFDPLTGSTAQAYQIKDQVAQLYNWSLSPNGATIAITRGKMGGDDAQVRLVPLDGGAEKTLQMQGATGVSALDWAADSKSLWASSVGDEENALLNIDLQGHARVVWRPKKMVVHWAIPSRDGRHLALHVGSTSANVWMLERP